MPHDKNSKTERITLTMNNGLKDFFNIISESDKNSAYCKTNNAQFFMKYGIYIAFSEFIQHDLSNFKMMVSNMKKLTEGYEFHRIVDNVTALNKVKGGKTQNEKTNF